MSVVIQVENPGKYDRLDLIGGGELWSLRDVSFSGHEGVILGILSRNGAGKIKQKLVFLRLQRHATYRVLFRNLHL